MHCFGFASVCYSQKTNMKTTAEVTRPNQAVNELPLDCHNEPSHSVLNCWQVAGGDAADPHPC